MELKQGLNNNTASPYDTDRTLNNQNHYQQPYLNNNMNDDIPPPHNAYNNNYNQPQNY